MVIQRWQSVWLLIAGILVIVFCCTPMAAVQSSIPDDAASITLLRPADVPVFMVVNILVAALLFISIFLFRNMRRQKTVTKISMLLIVLLMATEIYILWSWNSNIGVVDWFGSIFLLLGALVFAFLAYRGISSDERLLKAADRLR